MMDIYIVDDKYQKVHVLDSFESLVWTDRYSACGDFEMVISETDPASELLNIDWFLAQEGSDRLMQIETKEHNTDSNRPGMLTVKGRSLELNLFKRITQSVEGSSTFSGETHKVMMAMVKNTFLSGANNVPYSDAWGQGGTNPLVIKSDLETSRAVNKVFEVDYVYNANKAVADLAGIGFKWTVPGIRDIVDEAKPTEVYEVYSGVDRSSKQTERPIVAFRPDLENLTAVSYVANKASYKTSAQVFGDQFRRTFRVNAPWHGEAPLVGPNSSVLLVNANDIDVITPQSAFDNLLRTRALENLNSHNFTKVIDGEVQNSSLSYLYGRDYGLGDIVEVSDKRDVIGRSRVSEYTYIFDVDGVREFPSFTVVS